MKKFLLAALLAVFALLPTLAELSAEVATWTSPPTWANGVPVSATDAAKYTFYLRIWRGTDPTLVPATTFYLGETRNGGTSWGVLNDNTYIMLQANKTVLPPLVQGDKVIISVSTAFFDGTTELDSWNTTKPGLAVAYTIPIPPPPPPPSSSGCNPPLGLMLRY